MLRYTVILLVLAIVAGFLGFGLISGTAAMFAKWCFAIFLVMSFISFLMPKGK